MTPLNVPPYHGREVIAALPIAEYVELLKKRRELIHNACSSGAKILSHFVYADDLFAFEVDLRACLTAELDAAIEDGERQLREPPPNPSDYTFFPPPAGVTPEMLADAVMHVEQIQAQIEQLREAQATLDDQDVLEHLPKGLGRMIKAFMGIGSNLLGMETQLRNAELFRDRLQQELDKQNTGRPPSSEPPTGAGAEAD